MKAFAVFLAAGAIAVNVANTFSQNTAEGLKRTQDARTEKLCPVNPIYCS